MTGEKIYPGYIDELDAVYGSTETLLKVTRKPELKKPSQALLLNKSSEEFVPIRFEVKATMEMVRVQPPKKYQDREYPEDPTPYNSAVEEKEYSRSLLPEKELRKINKSIEKNGFLDITGVRELVKGNTVKESMDARGETYALDPELIILIDARINYKVFITGDNVFTREELFDNYPFEKFRVLPEEIFSQQEIGVFPPKKHAMNASEFEYLARDANDETIDFVMLEDMVGREARMGYKAQRAPVRVVKTKVYIGREAWANFSLLHQFGRAVGKIIHAQLEAGRDVTNPFMLMGPAATPGQLRLMSAEQTAEAEKRRIEHEERMREIEAAAARAAAEAAAKAEVERKLAEERAAALEERLKSDINRIQAMFEAAKTIGTKKARPVPKYKPSPMPTVPEEVIMPKKEAAPEEEDSVEI